jgi:HTH-type transcriptional regulator/antitoxin MqsA
MTDPTRIHPETGAVLTRGVRPMTLTYKGRSITFDMPGWYAEGSDDGLHSGEDMKVSDAALERMRAILRESEG